MAAPTIPNLLTSRNARSSGRGRGQGRDGIGNDPGNDVDPEVERAAKDKIVQRTDQDASVSRMSAVEVGYLHDEFAKEFVTSGGQRRFPIINRGTYVRTQAIDRLVDTFLSSDPSTKKQIISLGAGSDTRYFRLRSRTPSPSIIYHELDFPTNTQQKISAIKSSPRLTQYITPPISVDSSDSNLDSPDYHIHAIDLRTLHPPNSSNSQPHTPRHIDASLPTLLISECCLIYLAPNDADSVVNYFTTHLFPPTTPLALVLYEPINPFDAFGKVMVSNLAARGIVLQTLHKYSSLEAQRERMRMYGFRGGGGGQAAMDVDALFEKWVSEEEKERVGRVEMLDEVEEWRLLARHYCVAWGWRNGENEGAGEHIWDGWRALGGQTS